MRKLTVVSVVIALLALSAVALAAKPKDGTYSGSVISLKVKNGTITRVSGSLGGICNNNPIASKTHIPVKKGKFHFSGKVKDTNGKTAGKLTLKGNLKTKKKASGT